MEVIRIPSLKSRWHYNDKDSDQLFLIRREELKASFDKSFLIYCFMLRVVHTAGKALAFFDHLLPLVYTIYPIKVDIFDHIPTSSCKRSLWTPLTRNFLYKSNHFYLRNFLKQFNCDPKQCFQVMIFFDNIYLFPYSMAKKIFNLHQDLGRNFVLLQSILSHGISI